MNRTYINRVIIAIAIMITLLSLSSLLIFYLNHTFIPIRLKSFVIEKLTEYTGHTVTIDSLKFSLKKGFILKGIKIHESLEEKDALLFKTDSAAFRLFLIPSLRKQRVIIPSINLSGAYLNLERFSDGSWNISPLFQGMPDDNKDSRFSVILKEFSFDNSKLLLKDNYPKRTISKEITSLTGNIGLSLPDKLSIRCSGKIDKSAVYISAKYGIKQKELFAELKTENLKIDDYAGAYLPIGIGLIHTGIATTSIKAKISSFKTIQADGTIAIKGLSAKIKGTGLTGNYKFEGDAKFDIEDPSKMRYSLKIEIDDTEISNSIKLFDNITDINGALNLTEKAWATKNLSCLFYGSALNLDGKVEMPHEDFVVKVNLRSTLSLENLSEDIGTVIESGEAKTDAKLIYKKDGSYKIGGTSDIKGLRLRQKKILLSGDFLINGESTGMAGDWQSLKYKGIIDFNNVEIKGVDLLPFISKAAGQASFTTKSIAIKKLTGIAAGTEMLLNGNLDFRKEQPEILLHLETEELSVSRLISTLPEKIRTRFKDISAEGISYLNIDFKGVAGKPETYDYTGNILLNQGSLNLKHWPYSISNIDCDIDFKDQQIVWKDLTFTIKNEQYTSHGKLTNFTEPSISANIRSDILNAVCETETDENGVTSISRLDGKYKNSSFSFKGLIKDIKTTYVDINGDIYFDLKDAPYIFPQKGRMLKSLKPVGTIKLAIDMKGPLKEPTKWALFAQGWSKAIGLAGFTLKDFYMDYRMKDSFIDIPVFSVYSYGGVINISSRANLKTEECPFIVNMDIKDVNLRGLIKDTKDKDKKIKGMFASRAVLNGYLNKKDSLQGNGWLQVSDGYLWEFPVLHGIMDIILMVPPENIVLTDAFGNFAIDNNRVYTKDFKMLSRAASLLWVGSIGFDSTLDFNITGRFAENVIKRTTEPGRIADAILHQAGNLIMEVRLSGTLKEPIYKIVPFPLKRIFQEKVVDWINDIFGNIGE